MTRNLRAVLEHPTPIALSYFWSFGSILGVVLVIQVVTGLILASHYDNSILGAFSSVAHIQRDVTGGWILRNTHAANVTLIFGAIYIHMLRGIYFRSYITNWATWLVGSTLYILMSMTAFVGYVLPWGQMSYWGATVITSLLSVVPVIGDQLVQLLWGGFSVGDPTLKRFFMLHFLTPFAIIFLSLIHLVFLHQSGSSSPLSVKHRLSSVSFGPYYVWKDLIGFSVVGGILVVMICFWQTPWLDPVNLIQANGMVTPTHIKPEWYFLFLYAVLRAIPSKVGGVLAMVFSLVLITFLLPLSVLLKNSSQSLTPFSKFMFWTMLVSLVLLTYLGAMPAEYPFTTLSFVLWLVMLVSVFCQILNCV